MKKNDAYQAGLFDGELMLELCPSTLPPPVQPAPRWKRYASEALQRALKGPGVTLERPLWRQVAEEITAEGDGPAFLKAVRRGRGTAKKNIRVRLMEEVERLIDVERRRPCSNLKTPKTETETLTLE